MIKVKCVSIRENNPKQISVGKVYWMNEASKWTDCDGDEYAEIYSSDSTLSDKMGNLLTSHFERVNAL